MHDKVLPPLVRTDASINRGKRPKRGHDASPSGIPSPRLSQDGGPRAVLRPASLTPQYTRSIRAPTSMAMTACPDLSGRRPRELCCDLDESALHTRSIVRGDRPPVIANLGSAACEGARGRATHWHAAAGRAVQRCLPARTRASRAGQRALSERRARARGACRGGGTAGCGRTRTSARGGRAEGAGAAARRAAGGRGRARGAGARAAHATRGRGVPVASGARRGKHARAQAQAHDLRERGKKARGTALTASSSV
jgi:hypothetical protein